MCVGLSEWIRYNNRTVFGSVVKLPELKVCKRVINRTVFGSVVKLPELKVYKRVINRTVFGSVVKWIQKSDKYGSALLLSESIETDTTQKRDKYVNEW